MNLAKSYEHIFSPGADGSNVIRSPGILTFMRTPAVNPEVKDLKEAKALFAFLGVPYDEGNIGKPGSVGGPHGVVPCPKDRRPRIDRSRVRRE